MEKYLPFYLKFDEISREKNGPIRWRKSVLVGPKIFSSALRHVVVFLMGEKVDSPK